MDQYIDITIRTLVVYFFIIIAFRLFGKKELAQLSVFDLVFILLISNSVQNAMVGPDSSLLGGVIAAASLFVANYILKLVIYRNKNVSSLLQGEPVMLVHQGQLLHKNMDMMKITKEEIEEAMREHGVANLSDVDLAVMEQDGNISILSDNYNRRTTRRRKAKKSIQKDM